MTNSLRNLLVLAYATAHKAAPALAIVVAVSTVLSSIPSASAQIAFPLAGGNR